MALCKKRNYVKGLHRLPPIQETHYQIHCLLQHSSISNALPPEIVKIIIILLPSLHDAWIISDALASGWLKDTLYSERCTLSLVPPDHFDCRGWGAMYFHVYDTKGDAIIVPSYAYEEDVRRNGTRQGWQI